MILHNIESKRKDSGFTIVELLVVIVVIGILAAITIVSYTGVTTRANNTQSQANAQSVQSVGEAYNADKGYYPESLAAWTTGSTSTKLPSGITVIAGLPGDNGTDWADTPAEPLIAISAASKGNTIDYTCYITCTASTGGRINYWDFSAPARSATTIYLGAASAASAGAFVAPS